MGFYLRKSISVGPLRFNLSKSGVGVSAGVRGFRVGTGPRGNYVHMGRGGIYYRSTLTPRTQHLRRPSPGLPAPENATTVPPGTHEALEEIESVPAAQMIDSSSADLLREMDEKRKLVRWGPPAVAATVVALLFSLYASRPGVAVPIVLIIGALSIWYSFRRDALVKTVVLLYEMDSEVERNYGLLHEWATFLAGCAKVWHIEAQGRVLDRKYHAGASHLIRRRPTFLRAMEPPFLKTNIETVAIGVGKQVLHLFPDRILVFEPNGVGAVSYSDLRVDVEQTRFVEDGPVPNDATVVDHTWRFVNQNGGPDRRFKDNRQLPICLYDEITLHTTSGLHERLQVSRHSVADGFAKAIHALAGAMPPEV